MAGKKILLVLLPFWDPQIPPSGISCLKGFLQRHGYHIRARDANVDVKLKECYYQYFETLKSVIPPGKIGNFYKIAHDVLQNHMMAHINSVDDSTDKELIKKLVYNIFFIKVGDSLVSRLIDIVTGYFRALETYFLNMLERENPDLLGLSVYTGTLASSLFAFRLTREKYPGITTVMGGGIFANDLAPGSPNFDYFVKHTPYIDKILVGEGELLFLKLLAGHLDDRQKVFTLQDIEGKTLDLSTAGTPDFSDFDLSFYPCLTTYTSRSCPFRCNFCTETLQWGQYRKKNAAKVVRELLQLYRQYGNQLFLLSDSLLNPIIMDLSAELAAVEESIYWDGYLRADKYSGDRENTFLWRRSGFYRARLGIESGSQRVLDLMGKKLKIGEIKASVSALAHAGIKTTTYWVVGYPGETEADFLQTLHLVEQMQDDLYEADCSPFWYYLQGQVGSRDWAAKSTPLYTENEKKMLILQTWILKCKPHREEIYSRIWRFVAHCQALGIPNPYSLQDFHHADLRWKQLHENAVPPQVGFANSNRYIDENKRLKKRFIAQDIGQDNGDFGFE